MTDTLDTLAKILQTGKKQNVSRLFAPLQELVL
jgi:hypothetical protein